MGAAVNGRLVISLDFELHWGVRDHTPVSAYRDNLLGVRQAVPALLGLFRRYDIHATWATVGFLFSRTREELLAHLPERRPRYQRAELDPYGALAAEVGSAEADDPYHFAASLIDQISATPHQEIASHTFSHYYCLEEGQDERAFAADLEAACAIAARRSVVLRSLVFPRNQVNQAYLGACRQAGFAAYRGSTPSWLYDPRSEESESLLRRGARLLDAYLPLSGDNSFSLASADGTHPVEVPASRFLRPWSRALAPFDGLRRYRIVRDLKRAARGGRVYHLWWHPHNFGVNLAQNLSFLEEILGRFDELRRTHGMSSANMQELAELARGAA